MKVLIISHNPISTYQSTGKTLLVLFSAFQKNELCQLYIYPTVPDLHYCSSYYRITDKEVFESYFHFGHVNSRQIFEEEINKNNNSLFETDRDKRFIKKNKNSVNMMIRDIMWRFSGWYNRKLQQWINEQKPDCIFVNPGNAKFIYDIALKISEKYSLPIVTYLCDEYYFTDEKEFGIDVIWRKILKDRIEKLMVATSHLIVICNDLEQLYSERFSVETTTIYTGSNLPNTILLSQRRSLNGITYMGNLGFNRLTSILDVANALEKINEQFNKSYKIYLYSLSVNDDDMRIIDQNPIIEYCGFVTGDDYYNILLNSNCILHVEAFDSITVDKVKHSISTKIADCLASGVPLVAYGPESVASIKYLKKERCAFIATSKEFIETVLCDTLFNVQLRKCVSEAGIKVARINHCSISNSSTLKKIIQSVNRHDADGATKR